MVKILLFSCKFNGEYIIHPDSHWSYTESKTAANDCSVDVCCHYANVVIIWLCVSVFDRWWCCWWTRRERLIASPRSETAPPCSPWAPCSAPSRCTCFPPPPISHYICTMSDQRRRRWADVVQMFYNVLCLLGWLNRRCCISDVETT